MSGRTVLVAALVAAALASPATAGEVELDATRSVLLVLTHKAGVAAGLAHDHLVTAPLTALKLDFDPAAPEATRATLALRTEALDVDASDARARWRPRLQEVGAAPAEMASISEADRKKIRKAMLGAAQLDVARYPEVRAELLSLGRAEKPRGRLDGTAKIRLTLHGKSVERDFAATWKVENGKLSAEALGAFRFTEFGIKPYSAALGAVRNADEFHVYVALVGRSGAGGG